MDTFSIILCGCASFPFVFSNYIGFTEWDSLLPLMGTSLIAFLISLKLIPVIKKSTRQAGLFGKDLNKVSSKEM